MVGTPYSISSSSTSFGSLDDISTVKPCSTVKFVCSYGGRILPRYPDAKLRYIGGETRVISVDRSVSFSELQAKMGQICGWDAVNLRCQLPNEDLDALVSITSDEDLANLIEEYDLVSRDRQCPFKIRAFLHPPTIKSPKSANPEPIPASLKGKPPLRKPVHALADRCIHQTGSTARFSVRSGHSGGKHLFHGHQAHHGIPLPSYRHLIHHGNHWQ
ncbi:uncharacterized protein LOC110018953 [Phalaenopsis equestris]|uniref:uncharacterized protein LOC110018953 n=1 Tax=Phalaenopsis equestris TaxID=78828 RepID=UPI0009E54D04|nr:uncharacterized protein LOC110018953 [Phalaenopsis equestris]XP_020572096.1 uncharacterized protein LOC110018953 [Phalaenopsis equestris]